MIGALPSEDEDEGGDDARADIESFILSLNYVDDEKDVLKVNRLSFAFSLLEDNNIMKDDNGKPIKKDQTEIVLKVGDRYRFYEDQKIDICIEDLREITYLKAEDYNLIFIFRNQEDVIVAWGYAPLLRADHTLNKGSFNRPLFFPPVDTKKLNDRDNKVSSALFNFSLKYRDETDDV
jgi:hypothetical protein